MAPASWGHTDAERSSTSALKSALPCTWERWESLGIKRRFIAGTHHAIQYLCIAAGHVSPLRRRPRRRPRSWPCASSSESLNDAVACGTIVNVRLKDCGDWASPWHHRLPDHADCDRASGYGPPVCRTPARQRCLRSRHSPPSVPADTSRIRHHVTSEHTPAQIDQALAAFERTGQDTGVL